MMAIINTQMDKAMEDLASKLKIQDVEEQSVIDGYRHRDAFLVIRGHSIKI